MDESELKLRTKRFGLRIIRLVNALPRNTAGRAIGSQLVRSGTSVGANYTAACRSRSKAEFIARLEVVEEEADESEFWLETIVESGLMKSKLKEANELIAIITSSRIAAARNSVAVKQSKIKNLKSKM
jgi:four helix bundle protein